MESQYAVAADAASLSRWQRFWAHGNMNDRRCREPAHTALEGDVSFKQKVAKRISKAEYKLAEDADLETLQALMQESLGQAQSQRKVRDEGQGVIRKAGKKTVVFVNNFSGYLQAYSGIVEALRAVDGQYGGLAYSTLSVFLIVAVNKNRKEEHIESTLLALQREFSRLKVLTEVHSTPVMKEYIVEAFRLGIEFSREATLYYSRPTYRRLIQAITRPPQIGIEKQTADITAAMTQIEKERDSLDSQRLLDVQVKVDKMSQKVESVDARIMHLANQVEDTQKQNELRLLHKLKTHLVPAGYDPYGVLEKYRSLVQDAMRNMRRLLPFRLDQLIEESSYYDWETSRQSSILLLYGRTPHSTGLCWLSPAFFDLMNRFRAENRSVAFHCCQTETSMEVSIPAADVILDLIYQLLELQPSILRDQAWYESLHEKINLQEWRSKDLSLPISVLKEVLDKFPCAFLFIDRVDRIKGDIQRWMKHLVKLLQDSEHLVKIFLVASSNGNDEPNGNLYSENLEYMKDEFGEYFHALEMNQK